MLKLVSAHLSKILDHYVHVLDSSCLGVFLCIMTNLGVFRECWKTLFIETSCYTWIHVLNLQKIKIKYIINLFRDTSVISDNLRWRRKGYITFFFLYTKFGWSWKVNLYFILRIVADFRLSIPISWKPLKTIQDSLSPSPKWYLAGIFLVCWPA